MLLRTVFFQDWEGDLVCLSMQTVVNYIECCVNYIECCVRSGRMAAMRIQASSSINFGSQKKVATPSMGVPLLQPLGFSRPQTATFAARYTVFKEVLVFKTDSEPCTVWWYIIVWHFLWNEAFCKILWPVTLSVNLHYSRPITPKWNTQCLCHDLSKGTC